MHSNVMLRFMVESLQDPQLCNSTESVRQLIARLVPAIPLKKERTKTTCPTTIPIILFAFAQCFSCQAGETGLRQHGVSSCHNPVQETNFSIPILSPYPSYYKNSQCSESGSFYQHAIKLKYIVISTIL